MPIAVYNAGGAGTAGSSSSPGRPNPRWATRRSPQTCASSAGTGRWSRARSAWRTSLPPDRPRSTRATASRDSSRGSSWRGSTGSSPGERAWGSSSHAGPRHRRADAGRGVRLRGGDRLAPPTTGSSWWDRALQKHVGHRAFGREHAGGGSPRRALPLRPRVARGARRGPWPQHRARYAGRSHRALVRVRLGGGGGPPEEARAPPRRGAERSQSRHNPGHPRCLPRRARSSERRCVNQRLSPPDTDGDGIPDTVETRCPDEKGRPTPIRT